MVSSC